MKFIDGIKLSFLNLRSYPKTTGIIVLGMLLALCMIISACAYNSAMNRTMNETVEDNYSQCNLDYDSGDFLPQNSEALSAVRSTDGFLELMVYVDYSYIYDLYPEWYYGTTDTESDDTEADDAETDDEDIGDEYSYLEAYGDYNNISFSTLSVNGQTYEGVNDFSYTFLLSGGIASRSEKAVPFEINTVYIGDGFSQFSQAEINEYESKYDNEYLIGSLLENDDDIILSEYILERYGFTLEEAVDLIGSKITISFSYGGRSADIIEDYTLCGIIRTEFYELDSISRQAHILVPMSGKFMEWVEELEYLGTEQKIYFESFSAASDAYDTLSSAGVNTSQSVALYVYTEIEEQNRIYNDIVVLILGLILFAIFVFMLSAVQYYFGKRIRFIALERAVGMRGAKVFSVFIGEFVLCGLVAFVLSVPLSYLMIEGIMELIGGLVGGEVNVIASDFAVGLGCGAVFVIGLSLIFASVQLLRARKYSIVTLMSE